MGTINLNINTPIKTTRGFEVTDINFFSGSTFLDADIILWDVNKSLAELPGGSSTLNYNHIQSQMDRYKQGIQRRKIELEEFFKIGRTLVITNPVFDQKEYKIKNSNNQESLTYIDCLNIDKPEHTFVTGKNIQTVQKEFIKNYYSENKKFFSYNLKIQKSQGIPLMYIKDTRYVVSEFYRVKNGLLVILPNIKVSGPDQSSQFLDSTKEFIQELQSYDLPKPNSIPNWVSDYILNPEKQEVEREKDLNKKLEQIKVQIEKNQKLLSDFKFLKSLFSTNGFTLENAVKFVMEEFGFEIIENNSTNRDDLIIKSGKKVGVIEIKGLSKSAAEKNAAQLQKWVSTYHAENDLNPKGILIVNTFKDLKLENRKEKDFPSQMVPYSKQMKLCLITGLQLLCIYLDFKSKKIKMKDVHELLFNTVGELKYSKDVFELINLN